MSVRLETAGVDDDGDEAGGADVDVVAMVTL
jgi:hypothetical protein